MPDNVTPIRPHRQPYAPMIAVVAVGSLLALTIACVAVWLAVTLLGGAAW